MFVGTQIRSHDIHAGQVPFIGLFLLDVTTVNSFFYSFLVFLICYFGYFRSFYISFMFIKLLHNIVCLLFILLLFSNEVRLSFCVVACSCAVRLLLISLCSFFILNSDFIICNVSNCAFSGFATVSNVDL